MGTKADFQNWAARMIKPKRVFGLLRFQEFIVDHFTETWYGTTPDCADCDPICKSAEPARDLGSK